MDHGIEVIRTIDLGHEQLFVFEGDRGARVRVLFGATWLTEEGAVGDAIIGTGNEAPLHGGRTVIEALAPSRLQIIHQGRRSASTLARGWLRHAWRPLRRFVDRLQLGGAAAEPNA
jgi:hypothetical protein